MKILITGASSGLGAEFARQYASKENELILLARREEKLQQLQKDISVKCKSVEIIGADVTDFALLQEKIESVGVVDMVILNAGVSLGHSGDIPTIAEFKNLYDVNILANHAILEILMPKLREQRSGKVIFISSLASLFSMPSSKVYSSSKRKSELTDKNDFAMPFLMETKEGVVRMKKAIDKGREFYAFPLRFYLIIRLFNLLPSSLSQRIVNYLN